MNTDAQKISLLTEMIEFARVDGELHQRELAFLSLVANELKIDRDVFLSLFRKHHDIRVNRIESERIHQFYRLALLMRVDGVLHKNESKTIRELGINMGLSPFAMERILAKMEASPTGMLDPEVVLSAFKEQQN